MKQAKFLIKGIVQGVGFRPFCARTARRMGLNGYVKNTSSGVELLVEGRGEAIDDLIKEISENPPSAALITQIINEWEKSASPFFTDFSIEQSVREEKQQVFIPADIALCGACLAEMRDAGDRRYRYPFINCTLCGPRYSIIQSLPYDRIQTTMRHFKMCPECEAEYHDPESRRYHAQPNACPVCGPRLWVRSFSGAVSHGDPIEEIKARLKAGEIVGIKGIGGFHIACIVRDDVILKLRTRKNRLYKPFALMARDIAAARAFLDLSAEEERLLLSPQSPIVVCAKRDSAAAAIASQIAPQQGGVGVMLPYTPLHHLIMEDFDTLVMTSANVSDSPIISRNADAETELGAAGITDALLLHDRDIAMAIDDSVLFAAAPSQKVFIRRARGFVPNPLTLQTPQTPQTPQTQQKTAPPILAAGADIKAAFALSQDDTLFPGQYIGDLRQVRTAEYYSRALAHFTKLYSIKPEIFAHDAHPDYYSTRLAREFLESNGLETREVSVQHHAAHFASVLLEHSVSEPAMGVIFDGLGYGLDGGVWGGEFFTGTIANQERAGHLLPCKMLGGDKAAEEPWRYALSMLASAAGEDAAARFAERHWDFAGGRAENILKGLSAAPVSTSCGRLFDGVSALLSICVKSDYEGHAAMALEGAASEAGAEKSVNALNFGLIKENGRFIIDWRPAVAEILARVNRGDFSGSRAEIAMAFHAGLAAAVAEVCRGIMNDTGISAAALSGGVWQNRILSGRTVKLLREFGITPLLNKNLSPGDENISAGQAAIARGAAPGPG